MDIQKYLREKMAEHFIDGVEIKIHAAGFAMAVVARKQCDGTLLFGTCYEPDEGPITDDELVDRAVQDLLEKELRLGADAA